jgi:hypothetical protein
MRPTLYLTKTWATSPLPAQMMWYAIRIIRITHRSEREKLIAAETALMKDQWIAD